MTLVAPTFTYAKFSKYYPGYSPTWVDPKRFHAGPITDERIARGLTITVAAETSGVWPSTWLKAELGLTCGAKPQRKTMAAIAKFMNTTECAVATMIEQQQADLNWEAQFRLFEVPVRLPADAQERLEIFRGLYPRSFFLGPDYGLVVAEVLRPRNVVGAPAEVGQGAEGR